VLAAMGLTTARSSIHVCKASAAMKIVIPDDYRDMVDRRLLHFMGQVRFGRKGR
jgi:hypothetical protein